jgi:hypothetical protein
MARQSRGKSGKATRSVSTHLSLAAVGVVVAHPGRFRFTLHRDQSVGTDTAVTIAEMRDLVMGKTPGAVPIINHDEVVSGPVHLGELKKHRCSITPKVMR